MFNSAVVEVTPSSVFSSDVLAVRPFNTANSVGVAPLTVPVVTIF